LREGDCFCKAITHSLAWRGWTRVQCTTGPTSSADAADGRRRSKSRHARVLMGLASEIARAGAPEVRASQRKDLGAGGHDRNHNKLGFSAIESRAIMRALKSNPLPAASARGSPSHVARGCVNGTGDDDATLIDEWRHNRRHPGPIRRSARLRRPQNRGSHWGGSRPRWRL